MNVRRVVGFLLALFVAGGLGLANPAPAAAEDGLGGYCDADVDLNCRYYVPGWGWETCTVWTNVTECAADPM